MSSLLLTLGHNASAILVDDSGKVRIGFEEERLSEVKSDSRFPVKAIDQCLGYDSSIHTLYVSHWATNGNIESLKAKYWDPSIVDLLGAKLVSLSPEFTHHDAHACGAVSFAGATFPTDNTLVLVIDGFGNFGEHLSLYKMNPNMSVDLMTRVYGYSTSLGLMYQYATAYLGMKMHEDEYKLLGYEVHVEEDLAEVLTETAREIAKQLLNRMSSRKIDSFDPILQLDALPAVQQFWISTFERVRQEYNIPEPTSFEGRVAIAFLVQSVLEFTVLGLISAYKPTNIILAGGVFYNVRLNFQINSLVPGKVCIYPLAGDQGNGLGMYAGLGPDGFEFPDSICLGPRNLHNPGVTLPENFYCLNEADAQAVIAEKLDTVGFVNVVRGNMEFGPRALCNTSTLARAERPIVEKINTANGRNTVMPMAPVMTRETYLNSFEDADKIHKSEEYMVVSLAYKAGIGEKYLGAAHRYPVDYYTGRPQVTSDPLLVSLLEPHGMLINTSFNVHGRPIVHTLLQAVQHHNIQRQIVPEFSTVVISE